MFSKKDIGGGILVAIVSLVLTLALYAGMIVLLAWLLRTLNVIA